MGSPASSPVGGGRVAVIGAGIAGLACAHRLASRGFDVTVHEASRHVGGRMSTRRSGGMRFDPGANFLAESYVTSRALAREVGVPLETPGPVRHVFLRRGEFHRMNLSSLGDLVGFGGLGLLTRMRALWLGLRVRYLHPALDFFDLSSLPEDLLEGSAYGLARDAAGQEFADYIVDPFVSCMMFHGAQEISRGAGIALMQAMLDPSRSFQILFSPEGMAALPRALARSVELRLEEPVEKIVREEGGVSVVTSTRRYPYRAVVVGTTASMAARLLDPCTAPEREVFDATRYSSTITVSLLVPASLPANQHCYYIPHGESTLVSEFTNESLKGSGFRRRGHTAVDVGLHEGAARTMASWTDGLVIEEVVHEMGRLMRPLGVRPGEIRARDLQRWPEAIPKYDARLIRAVRRLKESDLDHGGVFLCGDYLAAPWVEGAVRSGLEAADRVDGWMRGRERSQLPSKQRSPVSSA